LSNPQEGAAPSAPPLAPAGNPTVAAILAWILPGLGHIYLKRTARGLLFLVLVSVSLLVGYRLHGNLYRSLPRQPLSMLGTAGAVGMGVSYFVLRYPMQYEGNVMEAGYEYGTAFLLTAGLMNWLLVLDAMDIARGKKG
jgi:hypothetical protein